MTAGQFRVYYRAWLRPARRFIAAYTVLSARGLCDAPGSAECRRLLRHWYACERPRDIVRWIIRQANRLPPATA